MKTLQTLAICGFACTALCGGVAAQAQRHGHPRHGATRRLPAATAAKKKPATTPTARVPESQTALKPVDPVMLFGEVKRSDPISFTAGMTVKQAIEQAGGFTDRADAAHITLRRIGTAGVGTINGLKAMEGDPVQNAALCAGDTLFVPRREEKAAESAPPAPEPQSASAPQPAADSSETPPAASDPGRVALAGAIGQPGTYRYQPVLLRDAIEAAGGLNKNADRGRILVHRGALTDPKSARKIRYDYNKVVKGQEPDIALLPGDVVEVPVRRRRDFFTQVGNFFTGLVKPLLPAAGTVLRPLLAGNPLTGAALHFLAPSGRNEAESASPTDAAQRTPTGLEAALMRAIQSEPAEVQQRILEQVKSALTSPQ